MPAPNPSRTLPPPHTVQLLGALGGSGGEWSSGSAGDSDSHSSAHQMATFPGPAHVIACHTSSSENSTSIGLASASSGSPPPAPTAVRINHHGRLPVASNAFVGPTLSTISALGKESDNIAPPPLVRAHTQASSNGPLRQIVEILVGQTTLNNVNPHTRRQKLGFLLSIAIHICYLIALCVLLVSVSPTLPFPWISLLVYFVPDCVAYFYVRFLSDRIFSRAVILVLLTWYEALSLVTALRGGYEHISSPAVSGILFIFLSLMIQLPTRFVVAQGILYICLFGLITLDQSNPFGLAESVQKLPNEFGVLYDDNRKFFFGVIDYILLPLVAFISLRSLLANNDQKNAEVQVTLSAVQQFAGHIMGYDTQRASAVLEDHAEFVDPELLKTLEGIVSNLQQYRSFIPMALLPRPLTRSSSDVSDTGSGRLVDVEEIRPEREAEKSLSSNTRRSIRLNPFQSIFSSNNPPVSNLSYEPTGSVTPPFITTEILEVSSVSGHSTPNAAPLVASSETPHQTNSSSPVVSSSEKLGQGLTVDVRASEERSSSTPLALSTSVTPALSSSMAPFVKSFAGAALVHFDDVTNMLSRGADTDISLSLNTAVMGLARVCREHGGTIQGVRGTSAFVTWGLEGNSVRHLHKILCRFAIALRLANISAPAPTTAVDWMATASELCRVSCAIHCGEILYGVAGDSGFRQLCCLGPFSKQYAHSNVLAVTPSQRKNPAAMAVPTPTDIELLFEAAKWHNAILISPELAQQTAGAMHYRAVDAVRWGERHKEKATAHFPHQGLPLVTRNSFTSLPSPISARKTNRSAKLAGGMPSPRKPPQQPIRCVEIVAPISASAETANGGAGEWMYSLQQAQAASSPFAVCDSMNRAMEKYILGHYEEAAAVFEGLSNQQRQDPRLVALESLTASVKASRGENAPYVREFGVV